MIDLTLSSPDSAPKPQGRRRLKNDKIIVPSYNSDTIGESDTSNVPKSLLDNVMSVATGSVPTHFESHAAEFSSSQQEGGGPKKAAKVNAKRKTVPEKGPIRSSGKNERVPHLSDSDQSVFEKESVNKKQPKKKPSRKEEKNAELFQMGIILEDGLSSSDIGVSLKEAFEEKEMKSFDISCPSAPGLIRW